LLELFIIVISFIGLIMQSSFFDYFSLLGVKPDIVLTTIVFYSVFKGPVKGGSVGAMMGLIEDLLLVSLLGRCLFFACCWELVLASLRKISTRKAFFSQC
jgi:rod shape-determining protein MreD